MLKSYFQTFGKVVEANIVYNHETMKSRGFGFVIFADEKTVQEVLKRYDDHYLFGKWIECKPALLKEEVTPNDAPQQTSHNPMPNHRGGYQGQAGMGHGHHQGQSHGHGMAGGYGGHPMHHQMRGGGMHGHGPAGNQRDGPMVGNMAHMPVPNVHRGRGGGPAAVTSRGGGQAMPRNHNEDSGRDLLDEGIDSSEGPKRGGYPATAPKRGGGAKVETNTTHMHHNPQAAKQTTPDDDDKEDSDGQEDTRQSGMQSSSGPSSNYYDYNSQYSHGSHQPGYSYTSQNAGYNYGMQGHPHPGSQGYGMYNYGGPGGMSRQPPKTNYPPYGGANYDYNSRHGYGQQGHMHMKTSNSHMGHNQYYDNEDYGEEAHVSPGARPPIDGPGYGSMKGADYNRNDRSHKAPGQGMQYPQQYGAHMSQQMYSGAGAGQHSNSEQSGSYDYTNAYKQQPGKPGPEMAGPGMGYNYRQPGMPIPSYPGVSDAEGGKPHSGPGPSKMPAGAKQGAANPNKK